MISDSRVHPARSSGAARRRPGARRSAALAKAAVVTALAALAAGPRAASATTVGNFSYGELQSAGLGATGCGTNPAAEPAIRISDAGNVFLGSELGVGAGSQLWRGLGLGRGPGASPCGLEFRGDPNGGAGAGTGGGDIDLAIAPRRNGSSTFTLYVASLNGSSVSVAHSTDDATTFANVPVQRGLPVDDRPWIAASDAATSFLSFTDQTTADIDILRSMDGGQSYSQVSQAIPLLGDYRSQANQSGNMAADANTGIVYQSYVAPAGPGGSDLNEFFVAVSTDRGQTWTEDAIPCSTANTGLDHSFPNLSVDPSSGRVWAAWSDNVNVYTAVSDDHGASWTCSGAVSTTTARGLFPWIAARGDGADLIFYGTPDRTSNPTWYVQFAQNPSGDIHAWQAPQRLMGVHTGDVCEMGANCTSDRQLFEDFGVDVDPAGYAHIAYSHDAPDLGGAGSYTAYAVQIAGQRLGTATPAAPASPSSPAGGSGPITLSPSGCGRTGPLVIRVRRPRHTRIRGVTVRVNGRKVSGHAQRVRSGLRIRLTGLPAGTSRVQVIVHLRRGHRRGALTTTRTYRC